MLLSSNTLVYFSMPEGYAADTYPRCRGTAVGEVEFDTPKDVPPFDLAPLGCAPKVLAPSRVINKGRTPHIVCLNHSIVQQHINLGRSSNCRGH